MVEAVFVVFFTTMVMFAFLQICIMVVDDMTANEAAFVAMRSAAVTMRSKRVKEATDRVNTYMMVYYPFSIAANAIDPTGVSKHFLSSFVFSDAKTVDDYYHPSNNNENDNNEESEISSEQGGDDGPKSVKVYNNGRSPQYKDYSGNLIEANTVKFYYYTRVMFGSLVAKATSNARGTSDNDRNTLLADQAARLAGIKSAGGNRRYQAARNRMVPSPDIREYGDKAYPGAEKFKNYNLSEAYKELTGNGG